MELIGPFLQIGIFLFLVTLGYFVGTATEKRHYQSIIERERATLQMQVMTAEPRVNDDSVKAVYLVQGSAVISIDYFKRLLAQLRNIFGGRVKSYESLLDRARREAILRMKEQARAKGAKVIFNLRFETSSIGQNANAKKGLGSVEAIAYGTAVVFK